MLHVVCLFVCVCVSVCVLVVHVCCVIKIIIFIVILKCHYNQHQKVYQDTWSCVSSQESHVAHKRVIYRNH